MGVIKQQGIQHGIVSVVGIVIGAISTIFIYPKDLGFYGLLNTLTNTAQLLLPLVSLGATSLVIRYFPEFRNPAKQHDGFLGLMLLIPLFGIIIFLGFSWWLNPLIAKGLNQLGFDLILFHTYRWEILFLSILLIYISILTYYISNFGKVVLPNILSNVVVKLLLPALVLLKVLGFGGDMLTTLLVIAYLAMFLLLAFYTFRLGEWHIRFVTSSLTPTLRRDMVVYAFFGLLGTMGTVLTQQIDTVMITSLLGKVQSGSYNFFSFMANTIQFPLTALASIGGPIIAQRLKENNLDEVKHIYQQSSINGLIVGLLIFVGVISNIKDLVGLTANAASLLPLTSVFVFLGLARLFDMATSLNSQIIVYSKYFRFNLFILIFLAIANVWGNYLFIKVLDFGTIGAAIATCISMLVYNLLKLFFIWVKFKMLPFTRATIWLLAIGLLVTGLGTWLQVSSNHVLNILIKSVLIAVIYVSLVYNLRVSAEFNHLISRYLPKIFQKE